jgi:hypothetical protein
MIVLAQFKMHNGYKDVVTDHDWQRNYNIVLKITTDTFNLMELKVCHNEVAF